MTIDGNPYLHMEDETPPGRKTRIICVYNANSGAELGQIKWYGRWRQYCFFPAMHCIFNVGCLESINVEIRALMEERKR